MVERLRSHIIRRGLESKVEVRFIAFGTRENRVGRRSKTQYSTRLAGQTEADALYLVRNARRARLLDDLQEKKLAEVIYLWKGGFPPLSWTLSEPTLIEIQHRAGWVQLNTLKFTGMVRISTWLCRSTRTTIRLQGSSLSCSRAGWARLEAAIGGPSILLLEWIDAARIERQALLDGGHGRIRRLVAPRCVLRDAAIDCQAEVGCVALVGAVAGVRRALEQGHVDVPRGMYWTSL